MKKTTSFLCLFFLLLPVFLVSDDIISAGIDGWTVPEGSDGELVLGATGDLPPIPADFFGPGSDPFDGIITLSAPFSPSVNVSRMEDGSVTPPYPANDLVDTEIIELDLVSTTPIAVTYMGSSAQMWDVSASLSSTYFPSTGLTDVLWTGEEGGFFMVDIPVILKLVFNQVGGGGSQTYELDQEIPFSSSDPFAWDDGALPGDFIPLGNDPLNLTAPGGSIIPIIPVLTRYDNGGAGFDPDGVFLGGGGTGYNEEWYYYPNTDWWNMWFYDHPYDPDRSKEISLYIDFFPLDPQFMSYVEIIFNWATPEWSALNLEMPPLPPLSSEDELLYIGRDTDFPVYSGEVLEPVVLEIPYSFPDFNPEWISLDIRGENVIINQFELYHTCLPPTESGPDREFGDAPEGALAYPSLGIIGQFPTCISVTPSGFVRHGLCWAHFGPMGDFEYDGNAGLCPQFSPNLYDQDECFNDGDAGLIIPPSYTIVGNPGYETVVSCDASQGPLGNTCQIATWGANIDIEVTNTMPVDGFVNVLMDWNQDGYWSGASTCSSPGDTPEHVLIDFPIFSGFSGPLSVLTPPGFLIGPNSGYVWTRFTVSESPVGDDWNGEGDFEDGESEDYLLQVDDFQEELDFGDAPDPSYPTLVASDGARHAIDGYTFLGIGVDDEQDGQPDPNSLGDDNDGNDDEDGVTFPAMYAGTQVLIDFNVSGGGYIDAWFDFDANGSWLDAGEYFNIGYLAAGNHQVPVDIPASASLGLTHSRFRISSVGGLSPTGYADDGEVEDYEIEIIGEIPETKWEQFPDLTPLGLDVDATWDESSEIPPHILADDFLCSTPGLITDIHVWGSWKFDLLPGGDPNNVWFTLSIHSDIPDPDGPGPGFSMPGDVLWIMDFYPGMFYAELFYEGPEGWYDPLTGEYIPEGDYQCWLYNFYIPDEQAFLQEGTPGTPVVYWLDVQAHTVGSEYRFGWKTSETHWNDDGVWGIGYEPYLGPWYELRYPDLHPYMGESIDLAFMITTTPSEDEYDFGDAPDPDYPTLAINNGANHTIVPTEFLGVSIDAETDGQPTPGSDGDDNDGNDDEDGIGFPTVILPGHSAQLAVTASLPGYLHAWVDFNRDGDWDDSGENILNDHILTAGGNAVNFNVPAQALPGFSYGRFRYITSSDPSLSYDGNFYGGEVEDQLVYVDSIDYGDAPEAGYNYPTLLASDGARHIILPGYSLGNQPNSIDHEHDGQPDLNALGDDNDGNDDEDGISMSYLVPGQDAIMDVTTSMSIGGYNVGYLDAWIDFNADGDWDDPDEQIANTLALSPLGFDSFFVPVPIDAVPNTFTFGRFRFSSTGGLDYDGPAGDGEVEDYRLFISEDLGESKILNPQFPDLSSFGVDVNAEEPLLLADDFLCIESGLITDIYIWASWLDDIHSYSGIIELSIWSDIPDPDGEGPLYSMPGELLWTRSFLPGEYSDELFVELSEPEWWFDPDTQTSYYPGDFFIWRYYFNIPEVEAFYQLSETIYWLSVKMFDPDDPENILRFGWKTSRDHWNDDAVWAINLGRDLNWNELIYPDQHPLHPNSIDLSFFISGVETMPSPLEIYIRKLSDRIRVEWTAVTGAISYNIYYSYDPYAAFPSGWTFMGSTSNLFYDDGPPLPGDLKKYYRVTATD